MEKIKDFIYEKSDIFFATLVVVVAGFVVLYNLNGWLFIDGENSKYTKHKTETVDTSAENTNTDGENSNADPSTSDTKADGTNTDSTNTGDTKADSTKSGQDTSKDNQNSQNTQQNASNQNNQTTNQTQANTQNNANAQNTANTQNNTNQNKSTQNTQTTNQNTQTQSNTNTQTNKTQSNGAVRNITIAPGSTAKSIANALKNNGLITDEKAFVQQLINSGNDTKLKAGTFSIKQGATTDEIIAILIKNPK